MTGSLLPPDNRFSVISEHDQKSNFSSGYDAYRLSPIKEGPKGRRRALNGSEVKNQTAPPEDWANQIQIGDMLDVKCANSGEWWVAKVQKLDEDLMQIHYMGWSAKFDEWVDRNDPLLIAPLHQHTSGDDPRFARWLRKTPVKPRSTCSSPSAEDQLTPMDMCDAHSAPEPESLLETSSLAETVTSSTEPGPESTGSRTRRTSRFKSDVKSTSLLSPSSLHITEQDVEQEKRDYNEPWCALCNLIKDEVNSDLVCCDGPCKRSFHLQCLFMDRIPEETHWYCDDCSAKRHTCFICNKRETSYGRSSSKVYKCRIYSCGKFYHEKCVWKDELTKSTSKRPLTEGNISGFACPYHACRVCGSRTHGGLLRCMYCPTSYHPHCTPPSARFNLSVLICGNHPEKTLPPDEDSEELSAAIEEGAVSIVMPVIKFPLRQPSAANITDRLHFRLPKSILETVRSQPPQFERIRRSVYLCKPQKVKPMETFCNCTESCKEDCVNRATMTECYGVVVDGKASARVNCRMGSDCGNRSLQKRDYPKLMPKFYGGKGWGLVTRDKIRAGHLVIEYVGEVIDEAEQERRLRVHRAEYPHDNNMYLMELGPQQYIDARQKGNLSRFINHSCDPSCQLQKWNVDGYTRIGIYALRDIEPDEELTYDYQFFTQEATKFGCLCGTKKCRGTLAPKMPKGSTIEIEDGENNGPAPKKRRLSKVDRAQMRKAIKKAEQRDQQLRARQEGAALKRLSLTSSKLPGEDYQLIRSGPPMPTFPFARERKLFLVRNVKLGAQFLSRRRLIQRRR